MAYATLAQFKAYKSIDTTNTKDDALIGELLDRATALIDNFTGRKFSGAVETRVYREDYAGNVSGRLFLYGEDIASVSEIRNSAGDIIAATDYALQPDNAEPKWQITFTGGAVTFPITVKGVFAWSAVPPADIVHACLRLAAFMYSQKDNAADVDRPLITGDGVTIMPSAFPADVERILQTYRRRV